MSQWLCPCHTSENLNLDAQNPPEAGGCGGLSPVPASEGREAQGSFERLYLMAFSTADRV